MKRLGLVLAFVALFYGVANARPASQTYRDYVAIKRVQLAQFGPTLPGPGHTVASGAAYSGPGDVSGIAAVTQAWVGIRAYSLATVGTKAISLCDNAGANCADASTNLSGDLVVTGRGAVACATSDTCLVQTLYDKSGALACVGVIPCDVTQATPGNMMTLKHNCRGGTQFCLVGTSSTSYVAAGTFTTTVTQPFTVSTAGRRTTFASAITNLIEDVFANFQLGFNTTSGSAFTYAGTVTGITGLTEGNMTAVNMLYSGASSNLNVNGASNTVSPGANSTTKLCVGACFNGGAIEFYEGAVFSGDQSSHFAALYGNQHTYWGF